MKILLSLLSIIKEMKVFDVGIYKFMIFAFAMYLSSRVSWFTEINPLIWLIIGLVCIGYLMTFTYRKRPDTKGYIDTVMANFHEYKLLDAAAFEIGVFAFGLAIYQYLPWFQTVSPTRYLLIFVFGIAWIGSMRAR